VKPFRVRRNSDLELGYFIRIIGVILRAYTLFTSLTLLGKGGGEVVFPTLCSGISSRLRFILARLLVSPASRSGAGVFS
jgi:hypothetical protein